MEHYRILQWDEIMEGIENSGEEEREAKADQLVEQMIADVYEKGSFECMEYVEKTLGHLDIFKAIERKVHFQTDFFVKTAALKKMSEEEALRKINAAFLDWYFLLESKEYICSKEGFDPEQMRAVHCLFFQCEFSILLQRISKRRLLELLVGKGKFSKKFSEEIWALFDKDQEKLREVVMSRRLADLEMKLNYVVKGQNELREELDFIEYLLIEKSDLAE